MLLEEIRNYFGAGTVYSNNKYVELCFQSMKDIEVIINHFDKYPLLTQKYGDYQLFKQAYLIVKNKDHLRRKLWKV
jgi:hypothetical protein